MLEIALLLAAIAYVARPTPTLALELPDRAKRYAGAIYRWAQARQIPADVLATWIKLETEFSPTSYSPEPGSMKSWACEVAGAPEKWGKNPDYQNAVDICAQLKAGGSASAIGKRFLFGSYGLMQVARPFSPGWGYAANLPNAGLFDPDTNLKIGTEEINQRRASLYGQRKTLTESEWANVRAAYVMGVSGYLRNPNGETAMERKRRFLKALHDLRATARPAA